MSVDAHVSGGAGERLVFPVRDVFVRLRVDVLLGEPEVDDVADVLLLVGLAADEEVLRLHVSVDEVLTVHVLHPRQLQVHARQR